MKKKQIEAVPYMTLPRTSRKKGVQYVAVAAWKDIGNDRHIILEVYRNKKDSLHVPAVRYVATGKDWGVFFPEKGTWTRQRITVKNGYERLCWQQPEEYTGSFVNGRENILYDQESLAKIKNFFIDITIWNEERWWGYFSKNERRIMFEKRKRAYELRSRRLCERVENTPALKEHNLLKWADKSLFHEKHILYYRKKGRKAVICCSECGGLTEGAWKAGESYESRFEKTIMEPRKGHIGYCSRCGACGTYHPQGKARHIPLMDRNVFLADKYLGQGIVLRYIQLSKRYILDEIIGDNGQLKMLRACEKLEGVEIARTYFMPGKNPQTDYQKHDPYSGEDFWDDCNLYRMNNISIGEAVIHPDTWENLQGTFLQYSALQEYVQLADGPVNARDYLERYVHFPQIEMMVKMKLLGVVNSMVRGYCGIVDNSVADRPDEFLGIRKDRVKMLIKKRGDISILQVLKMERRMERNWTEEQILDLAELDINQHNLEIALNFMTIQKLLNNISKYTGCEYGMDCTVTSHRLQETAITYFDYLTMRQHLGYDLHNTVYQKPRNLSEAHMKMVLEMDKEEQDRRMQEVSRKYPSIRQNYRKIRNRYFYEDETYLIRPARSAEEIVAEGKILHHCVGGDTYSRKHNEGKSLILFLRHKEEPEIPYITVEIKGKKIIQWYGINNGKPDKDNMQKWINGYVEWLINKSPAAGERPDRVQTAAAVGA